MFTSNIGGGTKSSIEYINDGFCTKICFVFDGISEIRINALSFITSSYMPYTCILESDESF